MKCRKLTFSIPESVVLDLDYLSDRLGVTRSALLSQLLTGPVADLRGLVESVPTGPLGPSDALRARGASMDLIKERVNSLQRMSDDLFTDLS